MTRHVDWRDRIAADPAVLVGKPVIRGTRISVELVVDCLAAGWTCDQILAQYDHLRPEDVEACLAFAVDLLRDAQASGRARAFLESALATPRTDDLDDLFRSDPPPGPSRPTPV